ncbi:gamma carbonic anhydrase family protein [Rhodococcus sp. NPDC057014]|uniref:gamma carbonic anhydrase family protein n=1 Tax=Rhodococcus sp. NPDC057014 TaxID=3346000 RepID=UPI003639FF72
MILAIDSAIPEIGEKTWIAPSAVVIGAATIGCEVGIWYNAVIRADTTSITIGDRTNIQDGCVVHADPGSPAHIGSGVSVGHNATLHGCTVGDNVLIGMGATVLNGAQIGPDSLVAAGALVPERMAVPPRSLVAGVPAKVRRELTDAEVDHIRSNAEGYLTARQTHAAVHAAAGAAVR